MTSWWVWLSFLYSLCTNPKFANRCQHASESQKKNRKRMSIFPSPAHMPNMRHLSYCTLPSHPYWNEKLAIMISFFLESWTLWTEIWPAHLWKLYCQHWDTKMLLSPPTSETSNSINGIVFNWSRSASLAVSMTCSHLATAVIFQHRNINSDGVFCFVFLA